LIAGGCRLSEQMLSLLTKLVCKVWVRAAPPPMNFAVRTDEAGGPA